MGRQDRDQGHLFNDFKLDEMWAVVRMKALLQP
jgi:hypothetical protein